MKKIIYVASPNSKRIYIWQINENASITLIQIINTFDQIYPMIIHPNKKILYGGTRPIPKITSFCIQKNGYLKKIEDFFIPEYSTHLNINTTGSVLYSVSYKENSLNVIKISETGTCISILQKLKGLMGCHSSKLETINHKLWIPCLKEDCIRLYSIDNTNSGILQNRSLQKINTEINSGPRHMIFHDSYNYAYIINEINGTINVIKIYKSNNYFPKIIQSVNILPNNYQYNNTYWASDIHIARNRWVYCSDRNANTISYFKILNSNKKLQLEGFKKTEEQPRGFSIDSQGKYLVAAGQKSNFIAIYSIDYNNGTLRLLSKFFSGQGPVWVTIMDL